MTVFEKETNEEFSGKESPQGQQLSAVQKQPCFLQIPSGLKGHVWGSTTFSLTLLLNTAVTLKRWV